MTKVSDIPPEIRTQLRADELPAFSIEHFRILLVMKCGGGGANCFGTVDDTGVVRIRGGDDAATNATVPSVHDSKGLNETL